MKKIYILSIAVLSMLFTACNAQLDTDQHGVTGVDAYYKTDSDANEAITTVYFQWQAGTMPFFYLLNLPSDDMYAGGLRRGANAAIEGLADYTYDMGNAHIKSVFTNLYQMVYRCNAILDNLEPETPVQNQVVAEAHFFRAWAYFYLTGLWGTPPLADHVLSPSEYLQPNADNDELWTFIEEDLKAAINSDALAKKSNANDEQVRITKTAAQAMLGKAYIWHKKWDEARKVLDEVIGSKKYELYKGDYGEILVSSTDFCCESVLETNVVRDAANRMTSMIWQQTGNLRGELFDWSGQDQIDYASTGYGQATPRMDLYNAFVAREGKDGYRLNHTILTYEQIKSHGIKIKKGSKLEQNDGLFSYKWRYSKADLNGSNSAMCTNYRFMRYAEVLLLAAEAHLQNGGDPSKALNYVNQIRERAKLEPLSSVTMDDVKIEKRLELCYENVRYMDLVRWGDAKNVLANKGKEIGTFTDDEVWNPKGFTYDVGGFVDGKHNLLPFPETEMSVNTKLTQNPNW